MEGGDPKTVERIAEKASGSKEVAAKVRSEAETGFDDGKNRFKGNMPEDKVMAGELAHDETQNSAKREAMGTVPAASVPANSTYETIGGTNKDTRAV